MASSLGSLVVRLGLDAADYTSGLVRAQAEAAKFAGTTDQAFKSVSRSVNEAGRSLDYFKNGLQAVVAAFGLRELVKLSDEYQNVSARLRIVTADSTDFANVQARLFAIANATRTEFTATGNLFYRLSTATRDLGTSQSDLLSLTDKLNKALAVSGSTGSTAKGALEQLSQALGANQLRGQEFNTVNEQGTRIIQALADGLGLTTAQLRALANEGGIPTETFIRGFLKGAKTIDEEFKRLPVTISGALTVAENNLQKFVGATLNSTGSAAVLGKVILKLSENIDVLAIAALGFAGTKIARVIAENIAKVEANIVAVVAETAATRANTATKIAAAEAEIIRTTNVQFAIQKAREQAVAELALAEAMIARGAVDKAFTAGAIANLAQLGAAQAKNTAAFVAAQDAMKVAQAGTAAASTLVSRAIGLLGGPIGAVVTILGAAVTAWQLYGAFASRESDDAANATEQSTKSIIANLDKQIAKLKERARVGDESSPAPKHQFESLTAQGLEKRAAAIRDQERRKPELTRPGEQFEGGGPTEHFLGGLPLALELEAEAKIIRDRLNNLVLQEAQEDGRKVSAVYEKLLHTYANNLEKKAEAEKDARKQLVAAGEIKFADENIPLPPRLQARIDEHFKEKAKADDPTKKTVDGQINALEAQVARERDILRAQEDFLKDSYGDGYIAVKDYYDRLQQARDENLRSTLQAYDTEIAVYENLKNEVKKVTEKQDAQNKIDAVKEKKTNLLRDDGSKEAALNRERIRSTEQYAASLDELNAKMLELSGNTADAALIRFDETNKSTVRLLKATSGLDKALIDLKRTQLQNADGSFSTEKTITVEMDNKFFLIPTIVDGIERGTEEAVRLFTEGLNKAVGEFRSAAEAEAAAVQRSDLIGKINDPTTDEGKAARALKQTEALRDQLKITNQLNDKTKEYGITIGYLDLATQHVNNERQNGNIGELTALAQISAANRELLPLLQAEADAYAKIAEKSKDPADLLKARALQEAVKQLGKQVDLVADKFNNIIGTAFSDALTSVITGTKSLKEAIKDFGKDVNTQIVKGIADEFKAKLFGQDGAFSGIGKKLSELFGFGKDSKGGATPPILSEDLSKILGQGKDAATQATKDAAALASAQALATAQLTLSTATETSATALLTLSTSTELGSTAQLAFSTASEAASIVMATLTAAASSAAAALTAMAASSAASSLGGIAGSLGSSAGAIFSSGSAFQGPSFGYAAAGTNFAFGGPTWVGEKGMELVNLPRGSQVIPSDQVGSWMKGRSGDTHVHINQTISGQQSGSSLRQTRNAARDGVMAAIRDR